MMVFIGRDNRFFILLMLCGFNQILYPIIAISEAMARGAGIAAAAAGGWTGSKLDQAIGNKSIGTVSGCLLSGAVVYYLLHQKTPNGRIANAKKTLESVKSDWLVKTMLDNEEPREHEDWLGELGFENEKHKQWNYHLVEALPLLRKSSRRLGCQIESLKKIAESDIPDLHKNIAQDLEGIRNIITSNSSKLTLSGVYIKQLELKQREERTKFEREKHAADKRYQKIKIVGGIALLATLIYASNKISTTELRIGLGTVSK